MLQVDRPHPTTNHNTTARDPFQHPPDPFIKGGFGAVLGMLEKTVAPDAGSCALSGFSLAEHRRFPLVSVRLVPFLLAT